MELFKLSTSQGSYDDYHTIDLGIYNTRELAEEGFKEFLRQVEKIKNDNICPLSEEKFHDAHNSIYTGTELSEEDKNTYIQWMYGSMYNINNLNLNCNITVFNLNELDTRFLKNEE